MKHFTLVAFILITGCTSIHKNNHPEFTVNNKKDQVRTIATDSDSSEECYQIELSEGQKGEFLVLPLLSNNNILWKVVGVDYLGVKIGIQTTEKQIKNIQNLGKKLKITSLEDTSEMACDKFLSNDFGK